jgi:hypothetical protein
VSVGHDATLRLRGRFAPVASARHGKKKAKGGSARDRIALDDTAVIADDLGHQCKSEAGALRFRGDEGIEQIGQSRTATSMGRLTRSREPGTWRRRPVRKAVERVISPSTASAPMASDAFFTRLRMTCTSWSRLPSTGGSEGS